jgi:hypothetical protein
MLLTPQTNIILDISMLHLGESEFATIQNIPAVAQIQNAMRDARMQMYKAASANGDSRTLISIRGDRQQIERRSGSPTRETDIAHSKAPGKMSFSPQAAKAAASSCRM